MPNWLSFRAAGSEEPPAGAPKKDDKVVEITPESLAKSMSDNKTELETKLTDLGSRIDNHPTLAAMKEFLDNQKTQRDAAARRQQEEQQNNNAQRFESMDQTTREYVDQTLGPIAQATLMQQGSELRRNIFEDAEAFPYYTGALKSKIDALLDAQPPSSRANPDIIRNVYKIVIYDNQKEIAENKFKSRFSSASESGTGTGGPNAGDKAALPVLTQQMKAVARSMGMSEAEYATSMKELVDAGEYA